MTFETINFSRLGEADVREEIVAPLLRRMGYRSGTNNDIIREQSLRYPRAFIGRKNEKRDPLLRGTADYICEVNGIVRWVIEAKSPDITLGSEENDQAYTYANHPEVRAVYFCMTNGREFRIYQTNNGPEAPPLLSVPYEQLEQSLQQIENLLGPVALLRDHPRLEVDVGKPIGPGLRSVVRITGGRITYHHNSLNLPQLTGMNVAIRGGAVERDDQGRLVALLQSLSPYQSFQTFNERLGLSVFETVSDDEVVSIDPSRPTVFRASQQIMLPRGEKLLDMQTWKEIILPLNLTCTAQTIASGVLRDHKFSGEFKAILSVLEVPRNISMAGDFEVHLS
jgi:Type I restriction enzyme R protein N terminus (HSDR_N)